MPVQNLISAAFPSDPNPMEPGSTVPDGLGQARKWQGTCEDSSAKIVPSRPLAFNWRKECGLSADALQREHDVSYL